MFLNRKDSSIGSVLLARGERGIAWMGGAMALILIIALSATTWLNEQELREAAGQAKAAQLSATGPMLATTAQQMISAGDLLGLRRLAAKTALSLKLSDYTIAIGTDSIVADKNPSRVNLSSVPAQWSGQPNEVAAASVDGEIRLRFPFAVPGKGAGAIELALLPSPGSIRTRSGASALICAVGLCMLVLVYRRSRSGLVEMDVVRNGLEAVAGGETSAIALQVDDRLGGTAVAWNKLVTEIDELRRLAKANSAAAGVSSRRAGASGLEAACDAMSQGLILVDDKLSVRFCNGAASTFLKRERTTMAGTAAIDLVSDDKFRDAVLATATGKLRRPVTVELEQPAEAGGGVLRFCIRPVRRGDIDSAMIIIEDITQQRTAERARNTFISQVTHELRTPLTNIRLYTETAIEDGDADPAIRANCLNVINQESRRLERIVSEMLSVAEIEAGSTMVRRDEVYFDVLVKELHADYRAQAEEKQITLAFNVTPKLPKLQADKDKLAIALHNLIGNALKYTPTGGKVTVNVDVRDGQLAIDVTDTGIGIAAAETEKIFDRFFRSGDPRVGQIVGTGLGLTLAREVMRLHGGDITVDSTINRGSTFTATLPVNLAA